MATTNILIQGFQGPAGAKGDTVLASSIAPKSVGQITTPFKAVALTGSNNAVLADKDTPSHASAVYGLTITSANPGETVSVQTFGEVDTNYEFTSGQPVFLGNNGNLTQTVPTSGFTLIVGWAITASKIFVSIGQANVVTLNQDGKIDSSLIPPIVGDEDMPYSKRVDFVTENILYRGEAAPGTLESFAGWRIRKIVIGTDGDVNETWAGGSANFDQIWDNRSLLTYS